MPLTTTAKIELISDLDVSEISNLNSLIPEAERQFWQDVSVRIENENPEGNIDGSNLEYRTQNYPISPTGSSLVVSSLDMAVYGIHSNATTGFEESTKLTVDEVFARDGRFKLDSAPDESVYDEIVVDYSYTGYNLDEEKVSLAVAYATAYLAYGGNFTSGEFETIKFKDLSVSQGSKGADNKSKAQSMLDGYYRTIRSLLPTRFKSKKIRSETFLSEFRRTSKKSDKFTSTQVGSQQTRRNR